MLTLFTADQVLAFAEDRATAGNPARTGGLDTNDLADFRQAVRYAAEGVAVYVPGAMAQTDRFRCVAELADGTRLYEADLHPGVDADDWAAIVD